MDSAGTFLELEDFLQARRNIEGIAQYTPMVPSPYLSERYGTPVLLKLELAQATGAFKIRGAANAIHDLPVDVPGVICCSTGNHGRAVAFAARERGIRAIVCMSELVPETKIEGIKALGAEARIGGQSQDDAQRAVDSLVRDQGLVEIPPFDSLDVIAGQGTIGLELLEQYPTLETVLIPLSGGGLAAGVAKAIKLQRPDVRIVGVTMRDGAAMYESLRAGHPVEVTEVPSFADSLGGGIGLENRYTFEMCRETLDDVVLVSESDIYRAMQTLYYEDRLVAEGGSVVGIAAIQSAQVRMNGPTCTIITGRNLDMRVHAEVMQGRDVQLGDRLVQGQRYSRSDR